jgi:hypothetical protein
MKILVAALSLISFSALAMDNLSDLKRKANDSIGKEMSSLQTDKTCINNAKSVNAFKACNYDIGGVEMQKEEVKMMEKKEEVIKDSEDLNKAY